MVYSLISSSSQEIFTLRLEAVTIPLTLANIGEIPVSDDTGFATGEPILIFSPDFTEISRFLFIGYSSTYFSVELTVINLPSFVSVILAIPSISERIAWPFGDLASNNSSTLGSPLVMSVPAIPPVWNVLIVN